MLIPDCTNNKESGVNENIATAFTKCDFDAFDLFLDDSGEVFSGLLGSGHFFLSGTIEYP